MIETSDLQGLQNNINYLRDCETLDCFDKTDVIDCFEDIFDILLKMNKMKVKEYDYGRGAYIVKENEE